MTHSLSSVIKNLVSNYSVVVSHQSPSHWPLCLVYSIYIYIYIYYIYIYKHKYIYIQLYVILYYIYIVYIYVNVSNIYIVTNSASDFKQLYLYRIQKNKRFYLKEFHNWQRRLVIEVKNSCLRVLHFTKNEDLSSHAIF